MAGLGIDINEIIKSAYETVKEIQQSATETVGTDCLWARATPVINSEDVVLQEYTLTQVGLECPKIVKVIVSNPDYNPGEYTIDLYGLNYVQPLEINITIQEWQNMFGNNTMPQKGDIVYVQIYHKLFEVQSSELIYTIAALPTYYKVILSKYSPTASRKETQEFRDSVEELTTSQEELFGDTISEEVADVDAPVETSYNNTTYVDPQKDYDIDSIVSNQIFGSNGNLISNAYYDFSIANKNITYNDELLYEISSSRNHLIYSCWCFLNSYIKDSKVIKLVYYSKDSDNWYFRVSTSIKLELGDNVTITRGTLIKVNAVVVELDECVESFGIAIKNSDMAKANKKLTKWYENSQFLKIYKTNIYKLIRGYDENSKITFDILIRQNELQIQIGNKSKHIPINFEFDIWSYIMLDISPENTRILISTPKEVDNRIIGDVVKTDTTIAWNISDFSVHEFSIEDMGCNIQMCNIRLYENEYEIGDNYKLDMYSPVTRNESKLILVDTPNDPNKTPFITPVK